MNLLSWLFLSELLLIGAVWLIIAELNDNFRRQDLFERMIRDGILNKDASPANRRQHIP
ncbi:hypothetical protein [Candidatus Velamenicoccus archaeovorus]|uniref:hypothetical protein n=1 Tax=Velamenicoccus archaeovorus TaxID=1930593 RepID=UPI0013E8B5E1|nr:hypothetical protein [Candidatus Velamenicoccus archaeovorus]